MSHYERNRGGFWIEFPRFLITIQIMVAHNKTVYNK